MTFYAFLVFMLALASGVLLTSAAVFLTSYFRFRGKRLITCPETKQPAAVDVDAWHAATTTATLATHLRLKDCTRWPERRNCGQECLAQIEGVPEDCLVLDILARWYGGKRCIYCLKELGHIDWLQHRPALMAPGGKSVEWRELRPEAIPEALRTHLPVCWNCHIAESFRREFPELVTDRDFVERA